MALHTLVPEAGTVHGAFSPELEPVLTIDPGDTVRFTTLDAGWNLEPRTSTNANEPPRKFEPRLEGHDGHALCGPVAIRGAQPGMTLAVQIGEMRPGSFGFTAVGGWPHPVNNRLGIADDGTFLLWELDADALQARDQYGHTVALHPFMGVMGMPPAAPGLHPTSPPRVTGGNLDCKELITGSTLYLPIAVPGGLFSTGDGHGRQGDGEVCVTAIECPMERAELTFQLLPELQLAAPRAHTPAGWITFGLDESLDRAALMALEEMVHFMEARFGLPRHQALGLASVTVDMRVTQIVNGVQGVHAVLAHETIGELGLETVEADAALYMV